MSLPELDRLLTLLPLLVRLLKELHRDNLRVGVSLPELDVLLDVDGTGAGIDAACSRLVVPLLQLRLESSRRRVANIVQISMET